MGLRKHWNRLPQDDVKSLFLEILKTAAGGSGQPNVALKLHLLCVKVKGDLQMI